MAKTDPLSQFILVAEKEFRFVVSEFGFSHCGVFKTDQAEPRDAHTHIRYFGSDRVIDVIAADIALGLFVAIGKVAPADHQHCRDIVPRPIVNFEQYLLARHASELSPPLPTMKPHVVFMTMYNQNPLRYFEIVSTGMEKAVGVIATRFRTYGRELLTADLARVASETRTLGLEPMYALRRKPGKK